MVDVDCITAFSVTRHSVLEYRIAKQGCLSEIQSPRQPRRLAPYPLEKDSSCEGSGSETAFAQVIRFDAVCGHGCLSCMDQVKIQ